MKRPKNFVDGVVVKDGTSKKAGMKSLDEFKTLTAYEEKETSLRGHGLTEEEVALMLKTDKVYVYLKKNIVLIWVLRLLEN